MLLPSWQMLLSIVGWCYSLRQMLLPILADVTAKLLFPICRLMLLPVYCCWLMLLSWQMLLPICVDDVKPHVFNLCNKCDGWCYCLVADGMATAGWLGRCYLPWSIYFNFSSEVLSRTSSHMWGRWYLPMFLLRDGLLTLIYNASLIVLLRFWSSLPTILKLSILTWWPLMLLWSKIGEGAFWCSLNLSAKVLEDSPMYSSSQSTLPHLNL